MGRLTDSLHSFCTVIAARPDGHFAFCLYLQPMHNEIAAAHPHSLTVLPTCGGPS